MLFIEFKCKLNHYTKKILWICHWFLCCFLPVALQSTCCLPEPWTKHITAPEQHGIFLYLPTAAPVLPPDPPLLKHPSHTHIHTLIDTCTHTQPSPRPPERMYRGMWGASKATKPTLPHPTSPHRGHHLYSSALGLKEMVFTLFQIKITHRSIRNTVIEKTW